MSLPDKDEVVWLDRGWQPVFYGFCPSNAAWKTAMKRMKCKGTPYPDSDGCVTRFTKDGKTTCVVTLGDLAGRTRVEVAGLLAHEATHIWQYVREAMQEKEPSCEFEAYAVQAIFQGLYQAWLDTVAPKEVLSRSARLKTTRT